jgi:drug/metabolite transporter (DMT)-like permease
MTPARAGHLAMLLFSLLVAGSFALGALAANEIAPVALNAVRFWIAAVILGVASLATTGISQGAVSALWRYPLLAVFLTTYFVAMFEGLKTAPPVSAAAVFTLTPLMAGVFGWLLLRQRFTPRILLALLIGGIGALWVIFRADLAALLRFEIGRGELIYLGGCLAHAVYTPLVRRLNRGEPALVFSFGVLLAGALLLTAFGWADLRTTDWTALPAIVWITILYTAVFASAATFTLLQFATMRLPSSKVMAYTYLVPSWVIVWGVGLGGSTPPLIVMAGLGITIVALVLLLGED